MAEITRRSNPVYKTLNKPLTIMGVERTLFATALFTGGGFQVLFSTFLGRHRDLRHPAFSGPDSNTARSQDARVHHSGDVAHLSGRIRPLRSIRQRP